MLQAATTKWTRNAGEGGASRERMEKCRALEDEWRIDHSRFLRADQRLKPQPVRCGDLRCPPYRKRAVELRKSDGRHRRSQRIRLGEAHLRPFGKKVCYDFQLSGVSTPLMSHIHRGEPLQNGPPIVTLFTGPGGNLHDCVVWLRGPLSEMVPARVASTSASSPPNFPTAPCADN